MVWITHFLCVLQLMVTYYVETSKMGGSILSDWRVSHSHYLLQLIITYYNKASEMSVYIPSDGLFKPFSVHPGGEDNLLC